jgi:Domain of unknown function (DUF3854)
MKLKDKKSDFPNVSGSRNSLDKRSDKRLNYFDKRKSINYQHHDIKYVSRTHPCQICQKPDWCSYTVNSFGEIVLALCQRISDGSVKQARDNSFIHVLKDAQRITNYVNPVIKITNPKAEISRCNAVYTSLLEQVRVINEEVEDGETSALFSNHAENLLKRGLGDDSIARNFYASVPNLATGNLTGVPGFYKYSDGKWRLNTYHKGFYVPFRNHKGLIFGLQIRLDFPIGKTKYVWLSTADKKTGASSGSPLHFVNTNIINRTKAVYVTEGALKADIIGELGKVGVIAMGGVKAVKPEHLVEVIKLLFSDLQKVFIAFDMDFQTNETVAKALRNVEKEFKKWEGLEVNTLVWNLSDGKGFDDYLLQTGENKDE